MKKIFAMLLCLCMVMTFVPMAALASETTECTENCQHEAAIGATHYDTLAEAVAVGGEVMLLKSVTLTETLTIPAGKTITLDLNGNTISGSNNADKSSLIYIENTASLTIEDNSVSGNGKVSYAKGTNGTGWAINVQGELVLNSGTIELTGSWTIGQAVDVIPNAWGSAYTAPTSFTMNGGKIVSGDSGVRVASFSSAEHKDVSASFVMNGGEIDADWDGIYIQQTDAAWDVLSAVVNDGIVSGDNSAIRILISAAPTSYVNEEKDPVNFELKKGTFSGVLRIDQSTTGDLTITGGTFTSDPSAYIPDTHGMYEADGKYIVVRKHTIAFNSNGGSDVEAISTIVGETITLPAAPTHSNPYYRFDGWDTGSELYAAGASYTVDGSIGEFAAAWTNTYVPPVTPPVAPPVVPDPEPEVPEIEAPTVDTNAPVVDSTTTENEDGSTTKEETLENGTKVETTTNTDGSKTETATKTDKVENEDGSATTTTTTVTTNTSVSGETVKESTQEVREEKADGSATTTTTTVTETESKTEKVEVKEETVVKEDGTTETTTTATTETALSNGSSGTTTTDETGKVEAKVTVSKQAVEEAVKEEKPVELAMPAVEAAKTSDEAAAAATVTVTLPKGTESATVAIPVAEGTGAGAVAVIVNADGTETIVSDSKVTDNGLEVEVPDGAIIKVVDNSTSFNDVDEGDWEKDAVDFTSARNIMNGMGEAEFAPETATTRAMVWTMLARYAGVDTTTGETWDEVGRQWAMENGITDGTMADEEVTREQLVTMIWRFLGEADSDHDISNFEDHGDTSDWALVAKQWAVEMGIINGVGQADGTVTLDPKGDASRAQVAQIFYNFITKA